MSKPSDGLEISRIEKAVVSKSNSIARAILKGESVEIKPDKHEPIKILQVKKTIIN